MEPPLKMARTSWAARPRLSVSVSGSAMILEDAVAGPAAEVDDEAEVVEEEFRPPQPVQRGCRTPPSSDSEGSDDEAWGSNEIRAGDLLPRFELSRLIGRGAFGDVHLAFDLAPTAARRRVAVKCVARVFDSLEHAKRLVREVRLLQVLRGHPNIVELRTLLTDQHCRERDFQRLFLVFEWCCSDLFKLLNSSLVLEPAQVRVMTQGLLAGVAWLHRHHICHRDLKPANVCVNRDCTVKVADLGLARWMPPAGHDEPTSHTAAPTDHSPMVEQAAWSPGGGSSPLSSSSASIGDGWVPPRLQRVLTEHVVTRFYRAPELLLPELSQHYSFAVDVWSCGCIFAELLDALSPSDDGRGMAAATVAAATADHDAQGPARPLPLSDEGAVLGAHKPRDPLFAFAPMPASSGRRHMDRLALEAVLRKLPLPGAGTGVEGGEAEGGLESALAGFEPAIAGAVRAFAVSCVDGPAESESVALSARYPHAAPAAVALLEQLLRLSPSQRTTAAAAQAHPFFAGIAPAPDAATTAAAAPAALARLKGRVTQTEADFTSLSKTTPSHARRQLRARIWTELQDQREDT